MERSDVSAINPNPADPGRILREPKAAERLGFSVITLRRKRKAGTGPRAVRLTSRSYGYRVADLDSWAEQRATTIDQRSSSDT